MWSSSSKNQFLATLCANILSVAYGAVCGWPSAGVPILQSSESPLASGPLNLNEASWVTSIMCIGGFVGNNIFGWMSEKYGRKMPLVSAAIPTAIGWLLIIFAANPYWLYVSRFLAGFAGGGVFVLVPMFVAEISDDKIRGFLGSLLVFSCNIGILIAFIFGNYLSYMLSPCILLGLSALFLGTFTMFPETPIFLMKIGKEKEAERSLRFYRNIQNNMESEQLRSELDKIRSSFMSIKKETTKLSFKDFTTPVAKKALTIGLALVMLNQFCGCFAMLNYTASIFAESGSSLTPNMAAIVVGFIQLVGAYFSTMLVERAGRKFLLAFSAIGTGCGLVAIGAYTTLKDNGVNMDGYNWVPVVSFSFTIFIASWGVLTLPFLVIAETMPEKIRSFGTSFCMSLLWLFAFTMIKCFPILSLAVGMNGSMFIFSTFSFLGALFVLIVLPETKGKSFEEIMLMLER